uniref:Uncharacterized protein n=1 Tax=Siphoviridae sp. ctwHj1 TaxID=2825727 RepID=A0A8S5U6A7_9CAUD|nr:MAG TPA: hypothetical protein [Siphoviridae sp. ctwHj1]
MQISSLAPSKSPTTGFFIGIGTPIQTSIGERLWLKHSSASKPGIRSTAERSDTFSIHPQP